jgi:hypothetical protein
MYQPDRLHHSRLVRLLQHWAQPLGAQGRPDVAEQLSQWLSTVDAVQLSRALHALESTTPASAGGGCVDVTALERALCGLQDELTTLLTGAPTPSKAVRERADNTPVDGPDPAAEGEFAVHAARYQSLQKQIEARIGSVRVQMRQRLASGPAALRQLAVLDTVMEQMLGAREQRLWATLPTHLEKRMASLRAGHQQRLDAAGAVDEPQHWRSPGGWLAVFEQDARALLRCEIEMRMQPLRGLLEAARGHARAPGRAASKPLRRTEQITGMIE